MTDRAIKNLFRFELQFSARKRLQSLALLIGFVFITGLITGCSSGGLSCSQAQKMIMESNDFRQPATLEFVQGNIVIGRGKGAVQSKSETEPEPEAIQRRIAEHYALNPQMAVADYFGLIDARLKRTNNVPDPVTVATSNWYFDERYTLTEKGRKMWEDARLPVNETAVPTARRELIEVTGLTGEGDTIQAEYSWKWVPNEVGKSLDSSTEEFRKLPEKIRQDMIAPGGLKNRDQTVSFEGTNQGKAIFRKYDNGWRLISVALF
jgi:hypothetical protein